MKRARRIFTGVVALAAAMAIWLPLVHFAFGRPPEDRARALAARQLALWNDPVLKRGEIAKMRGVNAEWDFMGRSFLAWALANHALATPADKPRALRAIDAILDETLAMERDQGMWVFLMPYARDKPFVVQPAASQFLDGEIALVAGLRRLVEEREDLKAVVAERARRMEARMRKSPVLSAESYPDECWTFCNTIALAAMRVEDKLDGTDHGALFRDWVATARKRLVDPRTGLLVSSYTVDGRQLDGPEGSSIWMSAHALQLIDAGFARDQYERARRELARGALGFAWAAEWPRSWRGPRDVDSGPVVPLLDASAGSSGLAFVGAAAFGDRAWLARLSSSLELGGFPVEREGGLTYAAGNQVADAVILYAMELGPAWARVGAAVGEAKGGTP
jgi:Linalool dehydratase/isomerase